MSKHDFWHLTYNLDLQSQPSQGQGRPLCKISRSGVKRFSSENAYWWSTQPSTSTQAIVRILLPMKKQGIVWHNIYCGHAEIFFHAKKRLGTEHSRWQSGVKKMAIIFPFSKTEKVYKVLKCRGMLEYKDIKPVTTVEFEEYLYLSFSLSEL